MNIKWFVSNTYLSIPNVCMYACVCVCVEPCDFYSEGDTSCPSHLFRSTPDGEYKY